MDYYAIFWPSLLAAGAILVCYPIILVLYRLHLHPLSRFPGPKLAAITSYWGGLYDLPEHSSLVKHLPALHDKYGSILRLGPNRLHIRDLESYHQIFRPGSKFEKSPDVRSPYFNVGVAHSLFNMRNRHEAKARKDMFMPYFSKAAITRLEPLIQEKITKFLDKLQSMSESEKIIDLTLGFPCLTADVVMHYCYQKTFGALDAEDFQFKAILQIQEYFSMSTTSMLFPQLFIYMDKVLSKLPLSFLDNNVGAVAAVIWLRDACNQRVRQLLDQSRDPSSKPITTNTIPTVFDTMLSPDPTKTDYIPKEADLTDDAFLMFVAGTDTTGNTLAYTTWHILRSPTVVSKLKSELRSAMPSKHDIPSWSTLEHLPYLKGCVKEGLRFGYGVPGQMPRMVPSGGATFCDQTIPAGTTITSSAYVYHTNDSYFTNADKFDPDRWNREDSQELEKRLMSFSGGPRGCLGMNLAYAMLYITVARLFRRFDLTIEGTSEEDMVWDDCFVPKSRGHLRVRVKEVED